MNNFIKAFLIWLCVIAQLNFAVAQTTTAALLPPGIAQFLDNNGDPLTSGTVGFYLPGTLTFATTWQDALETIPNTNPIVLNAGGKAIIYGNQTYRQIVKDRNGNLIWDAVTAPGGGGGSSPTLVGDGEPVGTIKQWAGLVVPNQYAYAFGQQISRTDFPELLAAITQQLNIACTTGSNIFTAISDTTQINIGSSVELICVSPGTTVVSKTNSSVMLSNVSTLTLNSLATFFPFGDGDGSTTFTIPDLRGNVVAGRSNMGGTASSNLIQTYFGSNPNALGSVGGSQSHTLTISESAILDYTSIVHDPGHSHILGTALTGSTGSQTIQSALSVGGSGAPQSGISTTGITVSTLSDAGGLPHSIVQPTITLNYIIKVTPDTPISSATGVMSLGGMVGVIACGQGLNCSANTISANGQLAGGVTGNVQFNQGAVITGATNFNFISPNTVTIGGNGVLGNLKIVATTNGISPTNLTGTLLQLSGPNSTATRMEINAYNSQAFFTSVAFGGTSITPTNLTTNTQIGGYNSYGYNGSAVVGPVGTYRCFAAENWAVGKQGSYCEIATTLISSSTLTTTIRFENDGGITVPSTVTGGDKGLGSINLSGLTYTNGNAHATSANSPIVLNSTTGNLTCPTCATSSGGGAVTGAVPIFVNSAAVVSISGSALTANNDTNVTLTLGGIPNASLISPASLTLGWSGQLAISRGGTGTNSLTANQIVLGGSSTLTTFACSTTTTVVHGGTPPTCSQIVFGDITTNTITNSNLSQVGAATFKGNPTASLANEQDFTVQGLSNLSSPNPTLDFIPIYDHATGLLKSVTPGAIAGSVVAGVASVNTLVGSLTLNANLGLNVVSSGTTITITPDIATAANFEAGTAQKLLDASVVFTSETTTSFGTTTAFDFNTFINTKVTLTGNITTMNCSNMKAGQAGTIIYVQDGTGSRTAAFNTGTCSTTLKFAGATFPTLTTSASAIDVLSYSCRTTSYCAAALSKGYNP